MHDDYTIFDVYNDDTIFDDIIGGGDDDTCNAYDDSTALVHGCIEEDWCIFGDTDDAMKDTSIIHMQVLSSIYGSSCSDSGSCSSVTKCSSCST
mgnify:CR=1 FL=1